MHFLNKLAIKFWNCSWIESATKLSILQTRRVNSKHCQLYPPDRPHLHGGSSKSRRSWYQCCTNFADRQLLLGQINFLDDVWTTKSFPKQCWSIRINYSARPERVFTIFDLLCHVRSGHRIASKYPIEFAPQRQKARNAPERLAPQQGSQSYITEAKSGTALKYFDVEPWK